VNSLGYTNASLYHAKRHAILHPESVTFAPISGMHHARPNSGSGFCTFSGQVISAIKIYEEFGLSGAYFDLDGHYGNSIEDTREFNPLLNKAIPQGCNVNPFGNNEEYTADFARKLDLIGNQIKLGKIHYVVFAHGADSHMDDDLGWNCDTYHWVKCAEMFANWVNEISNEIGKPLPVTLALFGGYRKNNYTAVLDLHIKSILKISNIVCGTSFKDNLEIPEKYPSQRK
jgi:acetoin utilization deacetylase AcuC-like enzyme